MRVISRPRPKLIGIVLAVFIIAGSLALLLIYMNKPAVGIVNHAPPQDQPDSTINRINVNGKNISFSYASNFSPRPASTPSGNQLEIFEFAKQDTPSWNLNIEVSRLPGGQLAGDGSYNMRHANPSRYQLDNWSVGANKVAVFADTGTGYTKTAFLAHDSRVVAVSLSGNPSSSDLLDGELRNLLASLEWK